MSFDNSYKNYKVDSIYLKDICIGKADDSVEKILIMWQKTEKRVYVVTDENGKAEGIITLYDVLEEIVPYFLKIDKSLNFFSSNELIDKEKFKKLKTKKAKDLMTKNPITVNVNDDFMKVITLMYSYNFDYLPVIDENKKVIGIVDKEVIEKKIVYLVNHTEK
jgi:acetoin utilization protein AcuB